MILIIGRHGTAPSGIAVKNETEIEISDSVAPHAYLDVGGGSGGLATMNSLEDLAIVSCTRDDALLSRRQFTPVDDDWRRSRMSFLCGDTQGSETVSTSFVTLRPVAPPGNEYDALDRPKREERVKGDGNCLFRSIMFWLANNEDEHGLLRSKVQFLCF